MITVDKDKQVINLVAPNRSTLTIDLRQTDKVYLIVPARAQVHVRLS